MTEHNLFPMLWAQLESRSVYLLVVLPFALARHIHKHSAHSMLMAAAASKHSHPLSAILWYVCRLYDAAASKLASYIILAWLSVH